MFDIFPLKNGIENVSGFYCDGVNSGIKKTSIGEKQDGDLAFIRSETPCDVEAIFTTNKFQAAPIKHFKKYPKDFKTNFVLINSKNANAMTSQRGIDDIEEILSYLPENTLNPIMSSTGVIGYPLDKQKILAGLQNFDINSKNSDNAARAILTTDRFKKELCFRVELENGKIFHIAAICKGAGMIEPSMATMLCFIATDASIPKRDMQDMLLECNETSFNAISVDGDTSTNDTVLLLANGQSKAYHKEAFKEALSRLMKHLALEIVRDGEGSNKVVAFCVEGAKDENEAKKAAKALSNSLLVKTAIHGEDPNWGRIASTIGSCGIAANEESLSIYYDDVLVFDEKHPVLDEQREKQAFQIMQKDSFCITCKLGMGDEKFTTYGCDLGYEYVKINSDYRS